MADDRNISQYVSQLEEHLLSLDRVAASSYLKMLSTSLPQGQLIDQVVVPTLEHIGEGWESGSVALAQLYISGTIIESFVESQFTAASSKHRNQPPIAIAVLEDHHFLGKRIVISYLRADGFNITDYGHISTKDLVNRARKDKIRVLLISVLMLPSALKVKEVSQSLKENGDNTYIIVGGAPFRFDNNLWREVGADSMGQAASDAFTLVNRAIEAMK